MTTVVEFLAGNVYALAGVALVGLLALVVFAFGASPRNAPVPTRPIATTPALHEQADAHRDDEKAHRDDEKAHRDDESAHHEGDPVAVIGTPDCSDALSPPFVTEDAVAYEVTVDGPSGTVTSVREGTAFALDVDGTTVRVTPAIDSEPTTGPFVDDARNDRVVEREHVDAFTDADGDALEALEAVDASRPRRSRYLSGSVRPTRTPRDYTVASASVDDELAIVGILYTDDDDRWVLDPPAGSHLRYVEPATVHKDHATQ